MNYPHMGAENKDLEFIDKFDKGKTWLIPTVQGRQAFVAAYNPEAVPAKDADFMRGEDCVLGVTVKGRSRAYPYWICDKHHTVNDTLAGERVLVTD